MGWGSGSIPFLIFTLHLLHSFTDLQHITWYITTYNRVLRVLSNRLRIVE